MAGSGGPPSLGLKLSTPVSLVPVAKAETSFQPALLLCKEGSLKVSAVYIVSPKVNDALLH